MGKDSALKLYNALKSQGKYTKSFAEFQGILGDKQRSQKLYTALSNDGLYTKTFSDFSNQFGSGSETAHTTRTQTTTPKKTDFVADTINMLRTPSSQYTRPQQTQQTAPKRKWSNEVDVYSSMPDVVKQYAPTPTPLKTDSSVSMRSAATSTWNAADRAAREEYDRLHPKKEESFWERAARLMTDAEMGMGNENMEKATDMLASHYKTHDLQKLSDQAWNALGATQQKNITDEAYDELKRQYPQATEKELREAAAKVARAKSDETMYNLAVQKNMPDNAISFFARKMAEGNSVASLFTGLARQKAGTVGDLVAETEANERYGKKHKVAGIAGSVVGMASDPLTYAAGGVGGAATKGALWAGGKVLSEAAARKMSQTLGGKLLLGAVSGAANFGTFEAGGEAINQYKWGGTLDVDPETGRYVVGDFSLGKVASQMGHGLTMGGLTGAFGTWLGNVSTKAAQATSSTLGKLGVRAGELGVGLVGEGTIFATPEFISTYGDYNDVIKSVSDKNSPNYIADDKERSKYIAELKAQRGERMMDIWQDDLAMIAGFKAQHAIKSAGRTISELAASRRGKVGFVERMGRMLDGHPSLALSKEEQTELDKHGYGDLTQMVKEYKAYAQKDGDLPYNKITQLLNDKNVSEAARAKMYYYVTGHSLPMSAVIASNVIDNGDKTYTVQSLGDNGVITSRTYGNRKRADYEKARIDRQAELNGVAMAEQMFDNMDKAERLKAVCTRLAQDKGVSPETLLWLTRKDPKQMTAAEKRWLKEIEDAANEDAPQGENATVRHIKGVILDEYGVDVDKALRKAADSRTEAEETAISAYNNELAQAVAERKNAISQGETTDAYRRGYEADTQGMRDAYVAQMYEPSEDNAETLRGVESQITESAKYQAALERDELKQMTHKDGSTHLATLKDKDKDGNGKQVYIVDGDIVMKEDGSGIDADASSKSVIIYDPATGEKKMVSPTAVDGIESLGEVKTAEQREAEINAHMQDTIQRSKDWLEGNVANPVGMQIQLGDGRIATIEAMHEDGKSAIATLPDGSQFLVPNDVLQRIVNNGQYADYKARRDAEASKREAEQGSESAPETATEGGQPLPEEASPKEERREYAQGDVFDVVVDGQKMHAEIVSPKDADGRFVVNVDDGESMRTLYVTPEELAAMEYKEPKEGPLTESENPRAIDTEEPPISNAAPTEHTPTALERIPRDEKGNAQFHDVDTETAWDGLVEMSGNEETAHKVAEASLSNAEKKLKAAKALKEKGETPEELLRSIKENEAAVAEAQRVVDAWKAIVGEKASREEAAKAEAERKAAEERERAEAEEEARVEAEKKAEEERKTKEEERKERDENGQPFVVSSDGTTTFGEITEDTGLTVAPIKLSEGVADEMGNGYGLRHIEARHGDQIRKAGFSSVEEFVKYVASNYDKHNIKIGKKRANGVETYLIQAEDEHSNVLYVELSKDGSYWNVNSGGIFRKGYAEKKKDVGQNTEHPTSATTLQDKSFVQTDKDNGSQSADTHSDKQHPSADKGTTLPADQQTSDKENTKKVADREGENTLKAKIEAASADVNTEPTEAQKKAGNYKKGHVQVGTFDITIEQPEGSIRRGTDANGKQWESKMHNTYGYFRGTEGVDGDHIDVFLSNDIDGWNGRKVFVVDQYNPDGTFDEHKVMLGFNDMDEAKSDYLANYEKGWENGRRIDVSATNLKDFEKWIDSSHRKTKPFSEYSSVNKGSEKAEKKQEKQSVFDKAKEIADKEEKKRKAEADKPKQKPLTEAERKDAEEVAGALGYRVEWVDTMEENGTIDADKKVIRIAKDAENPLVQVLGHEVAHGVRRMIGGKFRALQKAAMEVVGEKEWHERIEKKRKLNAYTEGKLAEEVTCDIVGEALNDKDALKRLAESLRGEKGILARLRDAVVRMVEYFKNRGDKEGVRRMKAADKLLAEFESALKEGVAPEQVKPEGVDRSVREGKKDDKTLYGIHNISEDKLRKAMKLGGLANPSMAVVDKDKGTHEGFGAISLIAPSSLVDKQTGRTAGSWITDAYTQRYPFVERVMSDKGYKKFKSWVDGLDFAEKEKKEIMRQATDAMESDKDLAWELMYLREKGVDVKGYTSEVDYPWEKIIEEYPSVEDIIKAMDHNAELKETVTKLAKVEITVPIYKAVSADVRRRFKEETGENASPLNPIIRKRTHDIYNRDYAPKLLDENGMPKASDVRKVIGQMVEKYNATKKVDFNKSKSKASTYVHDNGLYADYLKWQEGKLEEFGTQGRIFRGYKNDGTRKYVPETLSNVSKAMKEESQGQTNGSEYTSFGSFIAKLAPRVDSKEEMRGSKSRLDADEAKQEFYEKWESTYYELAKELHSDAFSGEARLHDIVLQSDPKRYAKKEYGITLSPSFLKRLEALKKAIREDLKSAYFETKFERPVMLNEFAAAVVPKGIGDDVRKGLEDAGLVLYEYDPAKKGDRERAANEASASDGIRFNRSEKTELTAEERELRDNLVERMRKGGLDVVTDSEEMQRVIDTENERTRNKRSKKSEAARKRDEALYAVDWSTAFVSGKSREEAAEIRRERGRKFKEETKELYGRVLSGNFDDVTLRLIDKFVDKSTPNNPYERPISKRLPARALQKMRGGERTGSIDALFSRISESAVGKDGKALPRAERERAIEEKKKELLKKWAIATGNWHTDIADFTEQREPIGSGTDSDVYLGKDGKSVIKVSKGKPYGKRFRPDVDNVALFNTVFPGSRYTIEGYGEIDGKFVRFLKQPIVDFTSSTPLTEGERVAYMEKLGFKPINKENTAFSNGEIVASDLQKSNVVRDRNGNVRVIDADMKLHTKDFGGKFSYPDAETDTRTDGMQRFLRTADGEVYGLVKDGRIYLDPKVATAETAVHEYTHLWGDMLRRKDSEQWSHTVKELKNSVLWEEVKELYPELKTDDEIADEVLSTFSGRRGAERLREEARRVADGEGGVFTKAKAIETLERVKEAIARFWEGVARMFGINRYRSAEELADMAMRDLLDSKNPMKDESGMRKRGEVGDEGVKSLKGEEALTALDSIFGENEGSAIPPKISSFAKFKNLFKKPVRTFLGELVQVKEEVWNKILRNNRQDITGTVLPTIENADFAIRDTDGSTLYVKRFKGDGQERMYNVVVVNKHGEVEDYISSVHIKRDNNLRNKIKKGAELFLPNARTTDGTMSRNNSTPGAKVANYSETAKPRYSRKPGESIFDYASRVSEDVDRSVRERVSARDEYEKKVKSKGFQTKEALQNSMLGLQEFMSAIDHASGNRRYIEDIPDFENPILGENRLSSVNKEEMHQVAKTQFKPLMSAVAKLSGNGKESGELYDYMFAKHGLERDAVMRQREAQKEFDKYQKANPKGTKTIGDFVASLEGKDYAGLTALTAEDGRVKSIQSQIDAIDEQMKATDDQLLLRKLGGQKKRLKVDLLNAARDAADDIRKAFESNPNHDRSDINELWSRVNEVNGNTLRKLYESGMLTKEAYNDISSMYTNYIPMRGFDQTTSADAYAYLTHGDSAFNAPIKTAKGRSSKADNPIAYMQAMAESAIMQGNRNVLVKQKMLNFVRNHPSDLASVSDVWLQYDSVADEWKPVFPDNIGANDSASVVAKKMEAFEDKMKQMAEKHPDLVQRSNEAPDIPYKVVEKGQLNEHQVLVKQNGKSYIITVNGSPRAAQAANGLTNPDTDLTGAVGKVFEGAEALNRQLSSLYTTLNPDFIGSNYVRDALYSNTMVYVKEGAKYGGSFNLNFAKYNPAEMANLYARYNKGSLDTSNETHKLFLEFMQNGGETGFVNLKQIEKRKSEIAKAIKRDGEISAAQIWGGLGDAVDFANRAVENSARFAAYVTSRKSGRSVGRSVYDAKEISVNFNRKGSGSKFMGAEGQTKAGNAAAFVSGAGRGLYIFWNAGLQGLTNFSRQIGRHPGRALTLASLLFGFGALMSYLGNRDDDDENNYFNLPKYIRRSNVCYKIGDLFVTIPLPVEYRSFYGLGELASSTLAGKEDGTTKDIAKEAVSQVSQLFPIDFAEGGGGLHALIPSAVKPIVEAETNTAWTGLPIYKDNDFNKNMPEYTKVYKTANGHLVEIARALNDATGGNKYKKGFIDINPAKMEYVLKGMLGGAFSFPDKLVKTTETIMGDREFDWRNTPFANRFVKNADERTEYKSLNEQYFKLKDEMDVVKQQVKGFEKEADAGNEKYEKALLQLEDSKDYERLELFKDYEKELKGLNDELKGLRMSPDYDKAEEKELQKEIAELQRQLIDEMREIKK